jgi:hypothetical protein
MKQKQPLTLVLKQPLVPVGCECRSNVWSEILLSLIGPCARSSDLRPASLPSNEWPALQITETPIAGAAVPRAASVTGNYEAWRRQLRRSCSECCLQTTLLCLNRISNGVLRCTGWAVPMSVCKSDEFKHPVWVPTVHILTRGLSLSYIISRMINWNKLDHFLSTVHNDPLITHVTKQRLQLRQNP